MPNGNVSNSDVDNRTMEKYRRIDLKLKFSYDTHIDDVRTVILQAMEKHPKVITSIPADVWLDEIGEYDLKIVARCWVESIDYWPVFWEQLEAVKIALDEKGIEIPIPKRALFHENTKTTLVSDSNEKSEESIKTST